MTNASAKRKRKKVKPVCHFLFAGGSPTKKCLPLFLWGLAILFNLKIPISFSRWSV